MMQIRHVRMGVFGGQMGVFVLVATGEPVLVDVLVVPVIVNMFVPM